MGKRGNGEGSITRRKDGRWWGRHTVHTSEGPKQKAVYGKTRADVAAKLRKAMSEADSGLVFDAGSVTVGEYLDGWLSDSVLPLVEAGKLEHSTYVPLRRYRRQPPHSFHREEETERLGPPRSATALQTEKQRFLVPFRRLPTRYSAESPQAGRER